MARGEKEEGDGKSETIEFDSPPKWAFSEFNNPRLNPGPKIRTGPSNVTSVRIYPDCFGPVGGPDFLDLTAATMVFESKIWTQIALNKLHSKLSSKSNRKKAEKPEMNKILL